MKIEFTNKTVLITGATRGIGKSIAEYFHDAGANLILTGTSSEVIEKFNSDNRKKGIFNIEYLQADFANSKSTEIFLKKLIEYNKIDICVNNVGVNKINEFIDTSFVDFKWFQEINLNVPYKILKVVGPNMIANNYGRIVNIASIWSIVNRPGRSLYTISKNALVGLTKALSIEWAAHNVLVNAVSPGFTLTELTKTTNTVEQLAELEKTIPIQRMANPIEIAGVVAFLCSDLNTYITGQNITVDGGFTNV